MKKEQSKQIGRPNKNRTFTLIRVPSELHKRLRERADQEQRALQVVTENTINEGLNKIA